MGSTGGGVYLLTGATGLLGKGILASPHPTVSFVPLIREAKCNRASDAIVWDSNESNLVAQLEAVSLDGIVHLAAHYVADATPSDLEALTDVSIRLSFVLQGLAVERDIPFIMATTRFVGTPEQVPLNLYAQLKKLQEESLIIDSRRGLRACRLEFGDIYGEGDTREKFISTAISQISKGGTFAVRNPENILYPVHFHDAARAVVASLDLTTTEVPIFSVVGPEGPVAAQSLVELIAGAVGKTSRSITIDPSSQRQIDSLINSYRPRGKPPGTWKPAIRLQEGIERLLATDRDPTSEHATPLIW
jgi:nucleoside-diphosphate-sugar epimerase